MVHVEYGDKRTSVGISITLGRLCRASSILSGRDAKSGALVTELAAVGDGALLALSTSILMRPLDIAPDWKQGLRLNGGSAKRGIKTCTVNSGFFFSFKTGVASSSSSSRDIEVLDDGLTI